MGWPMRGTPEIMGSCPKETTMSEQENASWETLPSISLLAAAVVLLRDAKCPDCDGCGFTVREIGGCDMDGGNDTRECVQEQCLWCFDRDDLLAKYDTTNKAMEKKEGEK
jgi:hypothetical protein